MDGGILNMRAYHIGIDDARTTELAFDDFFQIAYHIGIDDARTTRIYI